jgi:hypothetical protein
MANTGGGGTFQINTLNNNTNVLVTFASQTGFSSPTNFTANNISGYSFEVNTNNVSGFIATNAVVVISNSSTVTIAGGNTLQVNSLTIDLGSTLGGTGTLEGDLFVNGTLAPGNSPGTFFISAGNLTMGYNRIVDMNYFTGNGSPISLNGNLIAGFPDFMGMLRIGYRNQTTGISLNMRHIGSFRSDNFDDDLINNQDLITDLQNSFNGYYADNVVDAYTVFGLDIDHSIMSIGGPMQSLRLRLQVHNLL